MVYLAVMTDKQTRRPAPHAASLNRLRAAVLGANDGIVSVAGIIAGVAGATNKTPIILAAGLAGVVAGAISMAAGEYVSVSSQRDSERSHGVPRTEQSSPWQAAVASALSFLAGAAVPLATAIVSPAPIRLVVLVAAVVVALVLTGVLSAYAGGAGKRRATVRVVAGGLIAVAVTYAIGSLVRL